METSKFGENLGEFFGTVAWLWIFHRFNQDGAVLLGYQHPWEHGHEHGDHGNDHPSEKLTLEEIIAKWDIFSERSTVPGDDDDDDDVSGEKNLYSDILYLTLLTPSFFVGAGRRRRR